MDKIREYSRVLNTARHQLFILDSCFSGQLISRGPLLDSTTPDYIEALRSRVARTVITAGGKDQRVTDSGFQHTSLFTHELVRAVRDGLADVRQDGFITVNDIFTFILRSASTSDQTPSLGTLPGDEAGEMVFVSPRSASRLKGPGSGLSGGSARITVRTAPSIPGGDEERLRPRAATNEALPIAPLMVGQWITICLQPPHRPIKYNVRTGDTLTNIAKLFRVERKQIIDWNGIQTGVRVSCPPERKPFKPDGGQIVEEPK